MSNNRVPTRTLLALETTLILLVAAWLRFGAFHEALIGADQSSILAHAADIVARRELPSIGMKSSVGVMQTAMVSYLAAVPLIFLHRVIAISWFFSALDFLAVACLYQAVRRVFGKRAAWVAAMLYATSPWVVEFVRWIWYQSLVSTFACFAFSMCLVLVRRKASAHPHAVVAAAQVFSTIMGMLHLAAAPWTLVLWLIAAVSAWQKKLWLGYVVGLLLSLMVGFPYLRYLAETGFADVQGILSSGDSTGAGSWNWATFLISWELLTGHGVFYVFGNDLWLRMVREAPGVYVVLPVLLLLSAGYSLRLLLSRRESEWPVVLTFGWALLAPLLFLRTGFYLQHFYLLFLFPAPYVCIGLLLERCDYVQPCGQCMSRFICWLFTGLVAGVVIWWGYIWTIRIAFEQRADMLTPTRAWIMDSTVDRFASYLTDEPTGQIIVIADFGGDVSEFDWMRNFLGTDRIRVLSRRAGFLVPKDPTCYLLGPGTSLSDLQFVEGILTPRDDLTINTTPRWHTYCIPGRGDTGQPRAYWEHGVQLLSVNVVGDRVPDGLMSIEYVWLVEDSSQADYHIFNHLLLNGKLVAQVDGPGIPAWYWRSGDELQTTFQLRLPESLPVGFYELHVGFYTWPAVVRVPLVDGPQSYVVSTWSVK